MSWIVSHRFDASVVPIADRHYNRRKVGSPQFAPPGRCLVLTTAARDAFWITSWPFAQYVRHAWGGAWVCSAFRNEGAELSSALITGALAATLARWPDAPRVGAWSQVGATPKRIDVERTEIAMVTFVNTSKTKSKRDPGRCYIRAGFARVGMTKGGLVALGIRADRLPTPSAADTVQGDLFIARPR